MFRLVIFVFLVVSKVSTALANDNPVVIELFTSQGCSACLPAEELVQQISTSQDVIVLSFHVDYWDYIGWADVFADPAYTERQKQYARVAGRRMVYTPQIIIQGAIEASASRPMELMATLSDERENTSKTGMMIDAINGELVLRSSKLDRADGGVMDIQLVRYLPEAIVDVSDGENAGMTLTHTNVVYEWSVIGSWNGTEPLHVTIGPDDGNPAVVLIQEAGQGRILLAAELE